MANQIRPIVVGAAYDNPLQAVLAGGLAYPAYAQNDTLTGYLYQGNSLTPLFSPTFSWYTANGTQSGYAQGQVLLSITNTQAALLEANGDYTVICEWTPASQPTKSAPIVRVVLPVLPAPGTATQTVTTYCALSDMLFYADWIKIVFNADVDGEGFINQRNQARNWMDQMIINCYRGAFVGQFEEHSVAAFAFGNVGWRRSLGPSQSLEQYLANDDLLVKWYVVEACAYKAISLVGLRQVGVNNQLAALGAMYRDMASRAAVAITAEVDINGDGVGELFIPLNATNTLRT